MKTEAQRAYSRGYYAASRGWPQHKPPYPPEPVVAGLMRALRELRDECDAICATFPEDDEVVLQLDPFISRADEALSAVTAWIRAPESNGES